MNIDLTGKVAVVTGGTRGIGRAIAESLSTSGAIVIVVGRDATTATEVASALPGAHGKACDMGNVDAVETLVKDVEQSFGKIDILVNNAGITKDNIIFRLDVDDWDAVLDTNLRGPFVAMRAVARGMMKRRWGRIVNISSVVGLVGNPGQTNYAASKAGLLGLTKSFAKELASRNVLANVVAPGFIETDMTAAMTPDAKTTLQGQIPLGRLGQPADIASLVTFLASEHAAYITGQVFVVDGGMVM